jgi:hypothetical protein
VVLLAPIQGTKYVILKNPYYFTIDTVSELSPKVDVYIKVKCTVLAIHTKKKRLNKTFIS